MLRGDYDWRLPERSNGSDDEDDGSDVISDSQPVAGIIYSTWFMNRIAFVPALSVLLFQWESNQSFSELRKCVNEQWRLHRQHNRTRTGFLMVVIFKASVPLEDDVLLERQVMTLRDDLGLPEDSVIIVQSFRLPQSVDTVVSHIKENAIASYSNCMKILKRKRSKLGRHSHIFTLIRYHIKLGFYAFLSHDLNSAKKYLNAAHKDLSEMQPSSVFQLIEIRDVGLIINALICRLLILSEDLVGASEQFDRHIRTMTKINVDDPFMKALRFTFYSWLQHEYTTMGLLMQGNLALCLRYVNSAANSLMHRMECSFALPDFEQHYMGQLDELMQKTPFYCGQIQRYDEFESDNTLFLDLYLLAESKYRQSSSVTSLLTAAHNLLLAYPRKRKRQVALSELRIARQLNRDGHYTAALPLFEKAISLLRKENWTELLISALCDARVACISLELITKIVLYSCELIALSTDGSTSALQKELVFYLSKCQDVVDVSSTGIVGLSQESGKIAIKSQFSPAILCNLVTLYDESGASRELCQNVSLSRKESLILERELPPQSYAVLTIKDVAVRISICHHTGPASRKSETIKVKSAFDTPVVFVQELFPLSLVIENSEAYELYTLNCSQENAIVDEDTCEPIRFHDPVPIPSSDSPNQSARTVKAQLYFLSSGNAQAWLKLFGDKVSLYEHEVHWHVMNPLEIVENVFSLSVSTPNPPGLLQSILRSGYPAILHVLLRNVSPVSIHVIEVFFDHEADFLEMKQNPSHDVNQEVGPGDFISLQFAFLPIKQCNSICPGQIRFNWKRSKSSCIQTYAIPVSTAITVLIPPLSADLFLPAPEDVEIGRSCNLIVQIQSFLQTSSTVHIFVEFPKSTYHLIGPIKRTVWIPANDNMKLEWRLYPLQPGFQPLPSIKITNDSGEILCERKR